MSLPVPLPTHHQPFRCFAIHLYNTLQQGINIWSGSKYHFIPKIEQTHAAFRQEEGLDLTKWLHLDKRLYSGRKQMKITTNQLSLPSLHFPPSDKWSEDKEGKQKRKSSVCLATQFVFVKSQVFPTLPTAMSHPVWEEEAPNLSFGQKYKEEPDIVCDSRKSHYFQPDVKHHRHKYNKNNCPFVPPSPLGMWTQNTAKIIITPETTGAFGVKGKWWKSKYVEKWLHSSWQSIDHKLVDMQFN